MDDPSPNSNHLHDLIESGYLPEAVVNFIVLLGWSSGTEQEFFTLSELEKVFDIKGISKSPSTYDTDKLRWMNGEYIRKKTLDEFIAIASPWIDKALQRSYDKAKICAMIQKRVEVLSEIPDMISFLNNISTIDVNLYDNVKSKCNINEAKRKGKLIGRPKGTVPVETVRIKYKKLILDLKNGHSLSQCAKLHGLSRNTIVKVKKIISN